MKKLFIILYLLFFSFVYADIINIPADQPTIQAGINVAVDGDIVLVQPDTYLENINYNGKNITVASLFLTTQDTSYISQTIIDGNQDNRVVTFESNEDTTAVLTGFTITNGNAYGSIYDGAGGGIFCHNSSPKLDHLYVVDNESVWYGGGIYFNNSSSILRSSIISQNSSTGFQYNSYGGGIYCCFSNVSINDVTICWNNAYVGGGIRIDSSNLHIRNSDIHHNIAEQNGGGVYLIDDNSSLENVSIHQNTGYYGGGIWLNSSPTLNKVTIYNNSAEQGAGLFLYYQNANLTLINVTISNNIADILGGGICLMDGPPQANLLNSIIFYNQPEQICLTNCSEDALISIGYSDIEGGEAGIVANNPLYQINWLAGNIDEDPLFVDDYNGDYHLLSSSPCIDAGDPASPFDTDGTIVDMGCYYYHHTKDFSADNRFGNSTLSVNFEDLSEGYISEWFWDFQNDGTYDSFEQNPSFTYNTPGVYDVKLAIKRNATWLDSLIKENYIVVQSTQLQAPQNPMITKSGNDMILQWDSVTDADYYLIYLADNPYDNFEFLDYTTSDTTYTHSGVTTTNNKMFYFIIGFDGTMEEFNRFVEKNQTKDFKNATK